MQVLLSIFTQGSAETLVKDEDQGLTLSLSSMSPWTCHEDTQNEARREGYRACDIRLESFPFLRFVSKALVTTDKIQLFRRGHTHLELPARVFEGSHLFLSLNFPLHKLSLGSFKSILHTSPEVKRGGRVLGDMRKKRRHTHNAKHTTAT